MAELPRHTSHPDGGPVRFRAVDLRVDAIRLATFGPRRALVAVSTGDDTEAASNGVAADDVTPMLQAAVGILTELGAPQGADESPTLDVDVEIHPDGVTTVVRPHGELDLLTSPRLEKICGGQLNGGKPLQGLQVDLSAVSFLDSSGLCVLVGVQRDCVARDTVFGLTGLTAKSRRLLQITCLDSVLNIV